MKQNEEKAAPPVELPRGRWLEPKDVSERLKVSLSSAYSLVRSGQFPVYQFLPGKRQVDSVDLEEWIEKRKITAIVPDKPRKKEVVK